MRAPSWHSFPSPVFPAYLTFLLPSQHHWFVGRQALETQSATALHPSWSHRLLPSLLPNAPMLSARVHISRLAELLTCLGFAKCMWQLSYDCCHLPQIPSNTAENMKSPWPTCSAPAGWLRSCCAARTWKSYSFSSSSAVSIQRWTRHKFTSYQFYILSFPFSRVRWVRPAVLIVIPLFPFLCSFSPDKVTTCFS